MYVEERMFTLYPGKVPEYFHHLRMERRIMKCAPFFLERLKRMLAADKRQGA